MVEEAGTESNPRTQLVRPLEIGLSIGHPIGTVGTLGAFVRVRDTGNPGILSTATVIAPPGAAYGHFIHQPGPRDLPLLTGDSRIAILTAYVSPGGRSHRNLDAALAELLPDVLFRGNVIPDSGERIEGLAEDLILGDRVAKVGRTTGRTEGVISALNLNNFQVAWGNGRVARFGNVIEVSSLSGEPFSGPGDAGALVWRVSDRRAVGLHFAGYDKLGLLLPLDEICSRLGIELLPTK